MSGEDTNRYPTDPLNGPAAMAETLANLERRVAALEGAPADGSWTSRDANGDPLVTLGALPGGDRGLEVRSEGYGWALVRMTTDGWSAPHVAGDSYDPSAVKQVTSATFEIDWAVKFGDVLGLGVEIQIPWATAAGTTGELRVTSNGGAHTDVHALGAASNGFAYVRWLHDLVVGTGPAQFLIEARRTGGGGNVTVYQCHGWVTLPDACTVGGTWI